MADNVIKSVLIDTVISPEGDPMYMIAPYPFDDTNCDITEYDIMGILKELRTELYYTFEGIGFIDYVIGRSIPIFHFRFSDFTEEDKKDMIENLARRIQYRLQRASGGRHVEYKIFKNLDYGFRFKY